MNNDEDLTLDLDKKIKQITKVVRKWESKDFNDLEITIALKYKIISLFLPDKCQKQVKQAQKNHGGYSKDGMSYMMPEAFTNLFVSLCKLNANPLTELEKSGRVSTGAFFRLIEDQSEEKDNMKKEIDELMDQLDGKGMVKQTDYDNKVNELSKNNELQEEEIKSLKKKLEEREEYYKEKIKSADERARVRIEQENLCKISVED
tara:strand:- start:177 stop:788 length:612 start_codon:yes stop_codon:yes gene_type:complete